MAWRCEFYFGVLNTISKFEHGGSHEDGIIFSCTLCIESVNLKFGNYTFCLHEVEVLYILITTRINNKHVLEMLGIGLNFHINDLSRGKLIMTCFDGVKAFSTSSHQLENFNPATITTVSSRFITFLRDFIVTSSSNFWTEERFNINGTNKISDVIFVMCNYQRCVHNFLIWEVSNK